MLRFVLFVRGGFVEQQLAFGEAAGAQETIERGGRQAGLVRLASRRQRAQQGGTGAARVLAFEPFDQRGGFRRDGAHLPAVLPRFGDQRGESVLAIAKRPVQQRVHRQRAAAGIRDVVEAGGDLLSASCQFTAGQCFQYQRRNESVTEQSGFFGFVIHRVFFLPPQSVRGEGVPIPDKCCVGSLRRARRPETMRLGGRRERDCGASPAGGSASWRIGSGARRSSPWIGA